jgi:hypothetical protein
MWLIFGEDTKGKHVWCSSEFAKELIQVPGFQCISFLV